MDSAQKQRRKERSQKEAERNHAKRQAALRRENRQLSERVAQLARMGEEHRQKVELMFMNTRREQEALEETLEGLTSQTSLLQKEAAESGGQLCLSRTTKTELDSSSSLLQKDLTTKLAALSDAVAQVSANSAEHRRLSILNDTSREDIVQADSVAETLAADIAHERRLLADRTEHLEIASREALQAQTRRALLDHSTTLAKSLRMQADAEVASLLTALAQYEEAAIELRDVAVPTITTDPEQLIREQSIPRDPYDMAEKSASPSSTVEETVRLRSVSAGV